MNVNDMVAALAAKTIDARRAGRAYNAIAEADGIANIITDFSPVDQMPVFMAATPDFLEKNPKAVIAYLQAWLDVAKDFQGAAQKSRRGDPRLLHGQGLQDVAETFQKALARVEVNPGFPNDLVLTCSSRRKSYCARKKSPQSPIGRRCCGRI